MEEAGNEIVGEASDDVEESGGGWKGDEEVLAAFTRKRTHSQRTANVGSAGDSGASSPEYAEAYSTDHTTTSPTCEWCSKTFARADGFQRHMNQCCSRKPAGAAAVCVPPADPRGNPPSAAAAAAAAALARAAAATLTPATAPMAANSLRMPSTNATPSSSGLLSRMSPPGSPAFSCEWCARTFSRADGLRRHRKKYCAEKPADHADADADADADHADADHADADADTDAGTIGASTPPHNSRSTHVVVSASGDSRRADATYADTGTPRADTAAPRVDITAPRADIAEESSKSKSKWFSNGTGAGAGSGRINADAAAAATKTVHQQPQSATATEATAAPVLLPNATAAPAPTPSAASSLLDAFRERAKVQCAVCLQTPGAGGGAVGKLPCDHAFCHPCISEWSNVVPSCPLCKQPFESIAILLSITSTTVIKHEKIKPKPPPSVDLEETEFERLYACSVCEGGQDEHRLLLCDGCDVGYHTYCLEPPMDEVPTGDWFCAQCEAEQQHEAARYSTDGRANNSVGAAGGRRVNTAGAAGGRRSRSRQRYGDDVEHAALGDDYDESYEFAEDGNAGADRYDVAFKDVVNHHLRMESSRRSGGISMTASPRRRAHRRQESARKSALQLLRERRKARDLPVAESPD